MKKTTLANIAGAATTTAWGAAQMFTDLPPPVLDQLMLATLGVALYAEAFSVKKLEKSPPPTKDATVARTPEQDRAEAIERQRAESPAPDAPGTFYCQAGDHIVDTGIVWLETITLGCRPCMEKLGRDISRADWMPRLWSVGPEGTRLARPIPRPVVVTPEPQSQFSPNPFSTKKRTGSALGYIRDHQDWTCARCHRSRDKMDGVYNTTEGFVCTNCHPTKKLGQQAETGRQRERRLANERTQKIVERQSEQIEKAYDKAKAKDEFKKTVANAANDVNMLQKSLQDLMFNGVVADYQNTIDPLAQALQSIQFAQTVVPDHTKSLNWKIEDGMVVVDADEAIAATKKASGPIRKTGHNASIVIEGDVIGSQDVSVEGHNGEIIVKGDVGASARVIATGHNATIKIRGHVHRDAFVEARGHNATVAYGTRDESAYVQAEGHNGSVTGKVQNKKTVETQSQQQARKDLAKTYGLDYDDEVVQSFAEYDEWFSKIESRNDTPDRSQKLYVCTCVRCGKKDVDNPVRGGNASLDAGYKCAACLKVPKPGFDAVPEHRRMTLAMMNNVFVYRTKNQLPTKGVMGQWSYVIATDQMFSWTSNGWIQVAMASAPQEPAPIITPVHKHSWMEAWGDKGCFCRECGARG